MSTRRNEGASTGHGDGNNGYKYSKKGCKWDLNDIEDDISGEMDGEVKERKELKRKRNLEVETAVAMLLGLAKSDGAHFSTDNDTENCSNTFPEIREGSNDQRIKDADSDLTRKGSLRLGPGDNRVRPPKAATKLLPHAKWRHIRLPDVVSALEAEDWVVMFVHFKYPGIALYLSIYLIYLQRVTSFIATSSYVYVSLFCRVTFKKQGRIYAEL